MRRAPRDEAEAHRGDLLAHLDVLAGREPQQILTGEEGRRVIALYDMFVRSNAERRALSP